MENNNDILCPSDSKIYEVVPDIMYPIRSKYNGLSKLGEFCKILSQFQTKHLTSLGISRILKHLEIWK